MRIHFKKNPNIAKALNKQLKKGKTKKTILMPIDKNGKEIDWFHGWQGVQRLAKAYGLDWADVGFMIEDQHAPKLSIHHIQLCAYVHRSLKRVQSGKYKHIKRSRVPINETDLHFAIRMDRRNIEYIYKHNLKSKPTKDFYKSVSQMYKRIMKSHPKHITGFAKTLK
jgi:hypothetical protein|tara:strand:- start:189 stop:689 length:501 start_codon:yes stop_codon:yes gene_type:complete